MNNNRNTDLEAQLRIAHDKLMQAQQKISNGDINEQVLLEQALDAVNAAQMMVNKQGDQPN